MYSIRLSGFALGIWKTESWYPITSGECGPVLKIEVLKWYWPSSKIIIMGSSDPTAFGSGVLPGKLGCKTQIFALMWALGYDYVAYMDVDFWERLLNFITDWLTCPCWYVLWVQNQMNDLAKPWQNILNVNVIMSKINYFSNKIIW